jgi:hypothetical protein
LTIFKLGNQVVYILNNGPNGSLDGWGMSFKHPGELWEVLARNMGGGMPPEVPKALVELCGPRVETMPMGRRLSTQSGVESDE